jgi:hypothetical protein
VRFYRILFALAALYNVAFAAVSGAFPRAFFDALFGVEQPEMPLVPWSAVVLLVGCFGLLYAYAAWRPERADLAIAIGLATKVVGPLAWLGAVTLEQWPVQTFPLVLVGDIVWWFPFLGYLLRNSARRPLYVIGASVALHAAACGGLLLVAPATELEESFAARHAWVNEHRALWTAVWLAWSGSSLSLLAVVNLWTNRLFHWRDARLQIAALAACVVVGCGVVLDLCGETSLIAWAARPGLPVTSFEVAVKWYQLLSPAAANGLYCLGGVVLSLLSRQVGLTRGLVGLLGMTMWLVGLGLTVATLAGSTRWMGVTGAGVMLLYLAWAPLLALRLRAAERRLRS